MTNLIHIVGPQGGGKTTLAMLLVEGLEQQGQSVAVLDGIAFYHKPVKGCCKRARELDNFTMSPRRQAGEPGAFDTIIIEHAELPADIDAKPGDLIIRLERAA